jgi:DivIVA domain-containing protein
MPLTPADVRNKQFSTTRLRPGYDEEEVDAFLDEVEGEFNRLLQENEDLRSKLAESLRGGRGFGSPMAEPELEMAGPQLLGAPVPLREQPLRDQPLRDQALRDQALRDQAPRDLPMRDQERRPEPATMGAPAHNMDSIARVLGLAQQTADQAVAGARREADETLSRARREASDLLTSARHQAEQITNDARARSESLDRDAQERHRQALGSLIQQREDLERRVDDLRTFERQYRGRLMAYLEGQLRDLDAGTGHGDAFPAVVTAQHFSVSGPMSDEADASGHGTV